jgi:hypothetical protein
MIKLLNEERTPPDSYLILWSQTNSHKIFTIHIDSIGVNIDAKMESLKAITDKSQN